MFRRLRYDINAIYERDPAARSKAEILFLYPWAVITKNLGLFGFAEMIVFVAILFVGYVYVWKKGALEWE